MQVLRQAEGETRTWGDKETWRQGRGHRSAGAAPAKAEVLNSHSPLANPGLDRHNRPLSVGEFDEVSVLS